MHPIHLPLLFMATACFASVAIGLSVDTSDQPASHPPLSPEDGARAITNPPAMIWRMDSRAKTYTIEMCQSPKFDRDVIRVEGIDLPFYNHSAVLATGTWHWRHYVVTKAGERSGPSPVRRFVIDSECTPFPVPSTEDIVANMPRHPRIYVTPDTLGEFRARRLGPAKQAWEDIKRSADTLIETSLPKLQLLPEPERKPGGRGKVFYMRGSQAFVPKGYTVRSANRDANRAMVLALAYLLTEDTRYGEAAKQWLLAVSHVRIDLHMKDRTSHDSVVYCFEYGLKKMAIAYDYVHQLLGESERREVLGAIEYHGEAAYGWCRDKLKLHLNYQNSHGQQCMHALLTTTLAVATEFPAAREWADYLVRQYVNRVAWGSNDGGYSEGQTYSHKVSFILDGLCALRTATGLDVFQKPRWRNTGDFWLYCMSLNYWWNHWGDCYPLLMPMYGSGSDAFITNFLAAMTGNRYVKWWSDTVVADPSRFPFAYLSDCGLEPKPPVDIPQARLFAEVGQLAAYDRFYDHHGNRIFFRSSQWGAASHAHADQNSFVLHAGGEILAPEAGYYTYCGDTYHNQFSRQTVAHNSILVDGAGQPKSITSKGNITAFFNAPRYSFFVGDASDAYGDRLSKFLRAVLFIRPDVFIVYDELGAPNPLEFTWLLHSFEAADIVPSAATMTVQQRDMRLLVRHVTPKGLDYSQSNERPHPIKDPKRKWSRYTEAFPQHYTIRVKTASKREEEHILALMHSYDVNRGPRVEGVSRIETDRLVGVSFEQESERTVALFQRELGRPVLVSAEGIETNASAASVSRGRDDQVTHWIAHAVGRLSVDGQTLIEMDCLSDAAADYASNAALAQICLEPTSPGTARLWLPRQPKTILAAPSCKPQQARPLPFTAARVTVEVALDGSEVVLWVDPVRDITKPVAPQTLEVYDSAGAYTVPLEGAAADNGDTITFAELAPREAGTYEITAKREGADILIQDRWDPTVTRRGLARVQATLREGVEIFARFAPTATPVELRAQLRATAKGQIVSVLRNGGFEEGIPCYPPRGWTVKHGRTGDLGWPGWSQDTPHEGKSCLKFVRPEDPITATSQPMRLRTGGRYVLRFMAKGTATHASVRVKGARGTTASVAVEPSPDWREYRTELDVSPGYCTVSIIMNKGGDPDQVLWVDDVEFGRVTGDP